MQKEYAFTFLLVILSCMLKAQIAASFIGNESRDHSKFNPNNYFLVQQNEPVDLSTGAISQIFPLFKLKGRSIEVPISITYNGTGIKVQDIPGIVGLGFNLNVGGYIRREVRHIADENKIFKKNPGDELNDLDWPEAKTLLANEYYNIPVAGQGLYSGWVDYAPSSFVNWPIKADLAHTEGSQVQQIIDDIINQTYPSPQTKHPDFIAFLGTSVGLGPLAPGFVTYDYQPDIFHFDLNGVTGSFVFDSDGYPHTIPKQDIKIEPAIGLHAGDSWKFTLSDGTKFIFSNTDEFREQITVVSDNTPLEDDWHGYTPEYDESKHTEKYTSAWFLSAIQSPSGDEVTFTYENDSDLVYTNNNTVRLDYHSSSSGFPQTGSGYFSDQEEFERTDVVRISNKKLIKQISSSQGTASFSYDKLRDDIAHGTSKLTDITISNIAAHQVKKFKFNYNYFTSDGSCELEFNRKRLKLISFEEQATENVSRPITEFQYNESENLPCWGSPQQDFWGYYNTNTHHNLIPTVVAYVGLVGKTFSAANRLPDNAKSQANILTEVVWPTKGSTKYSYELNQYFDPFYNLNVTTGGLRISEIINYPTVNEQKFLKKKYFYTDPVNNLRSSGSGIGLRKDYEIQRWWKNLADYSTPEKNYAFYVFRTSDAKYLYYRNEPVRYSWVHVEEQDDLGNNNGRTSYSFTDFKTNPDLNNAKYYADFTGIIPDSGNKITPTPAAPFLSRAFERGKLTSMAVYDKDNKKIKENIFHYNFEANLNPKNITAYWADSDDKFFFWGEGVWSYNIEIYSHEAKSCVLDNIIEKTFSNGTEMTKSTTISYHPTYNTLVSSVKETSSDDTEKLITYTYAIDDSGPISDEIRDKFLIDRVSFKETLRDGSKIDGLKITYNKFSNIILPSLTEKWNSSNNAYVQEQQFISYDEYGNIIQAVQKNGIVMNYGWDYNSSLIIASLKNSAVGKVDFFYNNFENDDGNSIDSKTGHLGRINGYTKTLTNLSNGRYIMTYWLKSGSEWVLKNKEVSVEENSYTINFTAEEHIDDLRFYRKGIMMTTYTHEPLIGPTSETDNNNVINFYEYDGLGRLRLKRDTDKNILKKYVYNYQIRRYK